jgi:hypothetical protein
VGQERARARLTEVYWLGGASGAGKSTVARLLAGEGLRVYDTDQAMRRHAAELTAVEAPELARFKAMTMDGRWCERTPEAMLDSFQWYRGEGFRLIVDDLVAMPPGPVLVEGLRLLPELVQPLATPGRAVWLLPTPQFRRAAFERRGSLWEIPTKTRNPERALANLLERDRLFTEQLQRAVAQLGLPAIDVDTTMTVEAVLTEVRRALGVRPPGSSAPVVTRAFGRAGRVQGARRAGDSVGSGPGPGSTS